MSDIGTVKPPSHTMLDAMNDTCKCAVMCTTNGGNSEEAFDDCSGSFTGH